MNLERCYNEAMPSGRCTLPCGHLGPCISPLRAALVTLINEAQAVADDHHEPRYTRLDEALAYARAAVGKSEVQK